MPRLFGTDGVRGTANVDLTPELALQVSSAAAHVLAQDPSAQVLVMVPEINLTPQLQARFEARFAHLGPQGLVALHSGLTPARLRALLQA